MIDHSDDDRTQSFQTLSAGTQVYQYRIINKIGAGGMGEVYLAEDTDLGRKVALKFLPVHLCGDESCKRRFSREARAIAAIEHNNVVTIHEVGEHRSRPFFSMQYLEGQTLRDTIKAGPMPLREAVNVMVAVCDGLISIHRAGVTHRDIKPSNIALDAAGRPKLLDFGLAHVEEKEQLTTGGQALGTLGYIAPELLQGEPADERSDVFSFGVTLYELTTGRHPFRRETAGATIQAVLNEDPESLAETSPDLPYMLQCILDQALQKDREQRYKSAEVMLEDLRHLQRALTAEEPLPRAIARPSAGKRWVRWAGGLAGLAVILFFAFSSDVRRAVIDRIIPGEIPQRPLLAILPFTDLSQEPMSDALREGLTETVASKLTQLERYHASLWVVPSREMREENVTSAAESRKVFGANLAISCATQKLEGMIRLTVSLIDTHTQRQLRSQVFDYRTQDLAEFQDSTVAVVARMLDMHLHPEEQQTLGRGGTKDREAYRMYVVGEGYMRGESQLGYAVNQTEIDSAISYFKNALKRDDDFVLALAGLGEAYWRKYVSSSDPQWEEQAIYFSHRAMAVDDSVPRAHVTLGLIHQEQGRYSDAADEFNHALLLDPSNRFALGRLATALERMNRTDSAEAVYRRAIALRPDYWSGYADLGFFYAQRGKIDKAKEQLQRAVETQPEGFLAWNNLGGLSTLWGDWDTAAQMWERSVTIKPTWGTLSNLGSYYVMQNKPELAAEKFEMALDINPYDYRLWINSGVALNDIPGRESRARQALNHGLELGERQREINPRDPGILRSLATARAELGDSAAASQDIEHAILLAPNNADMALAAAVIFEQIHNRVRARECVIDALNMNYAREDVRNYWPELEGVVSDPAFDSLYRSRL